MANEKRLIDANALLNWIEECTDENDWIVNQYNADWIWSMLDSAPTVDAVEVVHGRWVEKIKDERFGEEWDEIALYECSACKSEFVEGMGTWHYCPNCGAKMDGDGNV